MSQEIRCVTCIYISYDLKNLTYSFFSQFSGNEFPSGFIEKVAKIHRLLFHVLAHIYHSHFKEIVLLQLHAHLNAVFVHYVEFNLRFNIVDDKELEVRLSTPKPSLKIRTANAIFWMSLGTFRDYFF